MSDLPGQTNISDCRLFVSIYPPAKQKQDVLLHLAGMMADEGCVKSGYGQAVLDREQEFPTGLKLEGLYNVALAHAGPENVYQNAIIVGVLEHPMNFNLMEEPDHTIPVKVIFMFSAINYDSINYFVNKLVEEVLLKPLVVDHIVELNDKDLIYSFLHSLLFGNDKS